MGRLKKMENFDIKAEVTILLKDEIKTEEEALQGKIEDFVCAECFAHFVCQGDLLEHIKDIHLSSRWVKPADYHDQKMLNGLSVNRRLSHDIPDYTDLQQSILGADDGIHQTEMLFSSNNDHNDQFAELDTVNSYDGKYEYSNFPYSSDNMSEIKTHVISPAGSLRFKCSLCDQYFKSRKCLIEHKLSHFQCSKCRFAAPTNRRLTAHQIKHHGYKPYKCSICPFATRYRASLIVHCRIHTNEKPFKCSECSFATRQKVNLISHKRTHTKERPFKCPECPFATRQEQVLKRHQVLIHENKKSNANVGRPYKCPDCSFAAQQKQHLVSHQLIHKNLKPYKCSECPYAARQKGTLTRHYTRIHAKEKTSLE